MITAQLVRDRVEQIRLSAGDDEAAHSMEDSLREDLLQAIAHGTCEDPRECAIEALKTNAIEFERWCA